MNCTRYLHVICMFKEKICMHCTSHLHVIRVFESCTQMHCTNHFLVICMFEGKIASLKSDFLFAADKLCSFSADDGKNNFISPQRYCRFCCTTTPSTLLNINFTYSLLFKDIVKSDWWQTENTIS